MAAKTDVPTPTWIVQKRALRRAGKRERLATLVSLMLSSQTKDPVTAEAVYNLQRTLPNGLCFAELTRSG